MALEKSFGEFIKDHKEGIVKDMGNLSCSNCNDCCTMGVAITEQEYKKIKKFLKTTNRGKQVERSANKKIEDALARNTIYWVCPFSNSNKRCEINDIKPMICKKFHCDANLYKEFQKHYDAYIDGCTHAIADFFYYDWRETFAKGLMSE